jgi:Domain of unknown function (DUF4383)
VRRLATAESVAGLFGLAFVVVGVLGFVPGVVQDYGELRWWKPGSRAELVGVFRTSILDNLFSIGFGVVGLVAARRPATARSFLTGGGIVSFALGIYGLLVDHGSGWNFMPVDRAGSWLHIGVGIAMLYAGAAVRLTGSRPSAAAARS